jgi:hypothetical protein
MQELCTHIAEEYEAKEVFHDLDKKFGNDIFLSIVLSKLGFSNVKEY